MFEWLVAFSELAVCYGHYGPPPPGLDEMILHSKIEKKYQGLIGSNPWRWGNPRHLLGIHNEWEVTWDVTVIMVNKYMVNTF